MKNKIIGFVALALLVSCVPLVSNAATLEERVDTLIDRVDTLLDSLEGGMVLGASISSSSIQGLTNTVNSLIEKTKTLLESGTRTAAPYVPPTPAPTPDDEPDQCIVTDSNTEICHPDFESLMESSDYQNLQTECEYGQPNSCWYFPPSQGLPEEWTCFCSLN